MQMSLCKVIKDKLDSSNLDDVEVSRMYRRIRFIDMESVGCREEDIDALERNNDLRRDKTVSFPVLSAFETKLHHTFGTTSMKWFAFGMLLGLGPTMLTPELLFTLLSFLL